jgi:4-hydroxybenzoate polyprenyltransferase
MVPGPQASPLAAARVIAADIKLAHSVFALPFALLASFMAAAAPDGQVAWTRLAGQLALVASAMVLARTAAMLANRLLDRHIDARNPRTAQRALPSGRLGPSTARAALLVSAILFLVVCAAFGVLFGNWWPAALGLPVLAWICAYALLKRFTALCHLYLGSSLALSPLAAALAIHPPALATQPALSLLSSMVLCWVAGFDIIYALQDLEVDRAQGLHSIPVLLGPGLALAASRLLHALAVLCLIGVAWSDPRLGALFSAAVVAVVALLGYEHATVRAWGEGRAAARVFMVNGIISCLVGALGAVDVLGWS